MIPYILAAVGGYLVAQSQKKETFADGGTLDFDYSKISSVEVDGIDTSDYPDFVDAYISYAEYDGEPMTDEQIEKLNQDGNFVYEAVINHLFAKGGITKETLKKIKK